MGFTDDLVAKVQGKSKSEVVCPKYSTHFCLVAVYWALPIIALKDFLLTLSAQILAEGGNALSKRIECTHL